MMGVWILFGVIADLFSVNLGLVCFQNHAKVLVQQKILYTFEKEMLSLKVFNHFGRWNTIELGVNFSTPGEVSFEFLVNFY